MSAPEQDGLREALRRAADASGARELDVDVVLEASRQSRRRRRNAVLGGTAAFATLIATVGLVGGLAGLTGPAMTTADAPIAGSTQELAPQNDGQEAAVAPRDERETGDVALGPLAAMHQCGRPAVVATDATGPLTVDVRPDGPVAAGSTGEAIVTVTNTGREPIEGSIRMAPSVAVVDSDGMVVANRADAAARSASRPVDLAPEESIELRAGIEAVRCTPGRAPSALPAGEYTLTASVVVMPDDPAQPALVAVSPLVALRVE